MDFMVYERVEFDYIKLRLFGDNYIDVMVVGVGFKLIFIVKGFFVLEEIVSFWI